MKKIYYRSNTASPKAVLAWRNDHGQWVIESEGQQRSTPWRDDVFWSQFSEQPRRGDAWSYSGTGFLGAEGISEAIENGAEPKWLTTREEVEQFFDKNPDSWLYHLSVLTAWRKGDLPWGTVRDVEEVSRDWNRHRDWALPLVALVPRSSETGPQ